MAACTAPPEAINGRATGGSPASGSEGKPETQEGTPSEPKIEGYLANQNIETSGGVIDLNRVADGTSTAKEKMFAFNPPSGAIAGFSQPIRVSTALSAYDTQTCAAQTYQKSEPTLAETLAHSQAHSLCGEVAYNFCIALTTGEGAAATTSYLRTPPTKVRLACPVAAAMQQLFTINKGATDTSLKTVSLQFAGPVNVTQMYVTNQAGCLSGGSWEPYWHEKSSWLLDQTTGKASVFVQYRDIAGTLSACHTASINVLAAGPSVSLPGGPFVLTKGSAMTPLTPSLGSSVTAVSISPALPSGLSLAPTSGVISGTPTASSGSVTYTLTAANAAGLTASTTIDLQVQDAAPTISVGSSFAYTTGGAASITPSLGAAVSSVAISPALGNGLSFNTNTGVVSGTTSGTLTPTVYTLTASNSTGQTTSANFTLGIYAAPSISGAGGPYTFTKNSVIATITPSVSGAASVTVSPSLPSGINLNPTTGVISGTPTAYATLATYTLTASNAAGATAQTTFQMSVNDVAPSIAVSPTFINASGSALTITPTIGASVASVSISPALGNSLSLNTSTGVVSGTTSSTLFATSYTLTASNATGQTATASFALTINASPMIGPSSVEVGRLTTTLAQLSWAPITTVPVTAYEVALGSTSGASDLATWTDVGLASSYLINGLNLNHGTSYYASVRAKNSSNLTSAATTAAAYRAVKLNLAAGGRGSCFINASNELKCFGTGESGQLGVGHTAQIGDGTGAMGNSLAAVSLGTGRTAAKISMSSTHACAVLDNNTAKCWGQNNQAQLGLGSWAEVGNLPNTMGDSLSAISLGTGRTVQQIGAGGLHTCALLDNGSVKCWGRAGEGALGSGDATARGYDPSHMGDSLPTVNLGTGRSATAISVGNNHTCALLDNAQVKCWGANQIGQLGLGHTSNLGNAANQMGDNLAAVDLGTGRTATAISAGMEHTCAILDNARLKCWGSNSHGQLGIGSGAASMGEAANTMGDNLPVIQLGTGRTVLEVATGQASTCARLDNGSVKCWGINFTGTLGLGDTTLRGNSAATMGDNLPAVDLGTGHTALAIAIAGESTCAILDDNSVKCWGQNAHGQLGQAHTNPIGKAANEMGDNLSAIDLGAGRGATAIVGGRNSWQLTSFCAILDNATVKCWGSNSVGQLGLGNTTQKGDRVADIPLAVDLGTGRTAVSISVGQVHSCALLDNFELKCWGSGNFGALGSGSNTDIGHTTGQMGDSLAAVDLGLGLYALSVSATLYSTCVLLDDKSVKCFGMNLNGVHGAGDTTSRGLTAGTIGDNLAALNLGTGRSATALSLGNHFACALLDNGTLKCWGKNESGQLGRGNTVDAGSSANQMGDNLAAINLGTGRRPIGIAAGGDHACAILDNRSVKCWGSNTYGQLGYNHTNNLGDGAGEMGDSLPTVDLGTGRTALQISLGEFHSCALLDNATIKCWGMGLWGQLGQGNTSTLGNSANEMGDNLNAISLGTGRTPWAVSAKGSMTCAYLDNGTVKCWGANFNGQLGQGSTLHIGDGANEMGDNLSPLSL